MFEQFDKNGHKVIFDGSNWHDAVGRPCVIVNDEPIAMYEQFIEVTGISIAAAGISTGAAAITAFPNGIKDVQITLADPSATDAVIGDVYVTGEAAGATSLTVNVKVTTASATAGSTIKAYVRVLGW